MARPIIKYMHPISQLLFLALISALSGFVFTLAAFGIGFAFFPSSELLGLFNGTTESIAVLKYYQAMSSIGLFIVPAIIFAWFFSNRAIHNLTGLFSSDLHYSGILVTLLMTLCLLPLIDLVGYWNMQMQLPDFLSGLEEWMRNMEEAGKIITEKFTKVDTLGGLMINLLVIAVLPALGEEMLFRGSLQPVLNRWLKNPHLAVWITAIIFSGIHFQFFGFIPRVILGAFMGYLLVWSRNLWYPIIAHFINNSLGVILYYFYHKGQFVEDPQSLGTQTAVWQVLLGLGLLAILVYLFKERLMKGKELV